MPQLPDSIIEDVQRYEGQLVYSLQGLASKLMRAASEIDAMSKYPTMLEHKNPVAEVQKEALERARRQQLHLLSNGVWVYDLAQIVEVASRLDMLLEVERRLERLNQAEERVFRTSQNS